MTARIVGLNLTKDVFQVHGISETNRKVFNKKIKHAKSLTFVEAPCRRHGGLRLGPSLGSRTAQVGS
jgi:hypothetical protein